MYRWFASLIVISFVCLASHDTASAQAAEGFRGPAARVPHVYLMRGFMNVFSLGMDELAEKLQKRGLKAEVYNHVSAGGVVSEIIANRKAGHRGAIVLIGHSLGASAVVSMANDLSAAGIAADLVIPMDAIVTTTAIGSTKRIVNYYLANGVGAPVEAGPGFRGSIRNVDVRGMNVGHMSIDKSAEIQDMVLKQIVAVARPVRGPRSQNVAPDPETTASIPRAR